MKKIFAFLCAVTFGLSLSACSDSSPRDRFLETCAKGKEACECAGDILENQLEDDEFEALVAELGTINKKSNDLAVKTLSGKLVNDKISKVFLMAMMGCES